MNCWKRKNDGMNIFPILGPASELTSIFELVSNPASFLEHVSVFYTTLEFVLALEWNFWVMQFTIKC